MHQRRTGLVTDGGAPITLVGAPVAVGDAAPDFACTWQEPGTWNMHLLGLEHGAGQVRLYSVVPSVDTPVCSLQTVRFDADVAALSDEIAAYTVSVDTPYAMGRFCHRKEVARLVNLSDYRPERSFGHAYGVLVEESGELCRAVFVVDGAGIVVHAEVTPEIADHPDYEAALAALRAAVC
jgi:thioredoxin-dependent peroxiredoxin